jgi:hypothetical protein
MCTFLRINHIYFEAFSYSFPPARTFSLSIFHWISHAFSCFTRIELAQSKLNSPADEGDYSSPTVKT